MRLFVAAELPQEVLDALAETSALVRDSVSGRYVGNDLFHVTLAFLGETSAAHIDELEGALLDACDSHAPFVASLGALGTFGRASSAVLWQGFSTGRKEFDALARDVRRNLKQSGFSYDTKGFLPHVTLMRRADVTRGALPMPCVDSGIVSTVTLFASDLSGSRPRYEPLLSIHLEESSTD